MSTIPSRTSFLAVFSFLSGLVAVSCSTTTWLLLEIGKVKSHGMGGTSSVEQLELAARILAGVAVAFAITSVGLALGGRTAVVEGQGSVGGRGFYRTGTFISLASVIGAMTVL